MPEGEKQTEKSQSNATERDLLSLVQTEHDIAIGYWNDALTESQDINLRRYYGLPYGDEVTGRSKAVSRDCAQVVDWALPDLLEPFLNNNSLVKFKPNQKAHIEYARQASDYTNHIFWEDNDGFQNLYDGFKDGLIQKVGLVKVFWNDQKREIEETIRGVSVAQLGALEADDAVTVDAVRPEEDQILPPPTDQLTNTQQPAAPLQFVTVDITRTVGNGRVSVVPIPPEEFLISPRAASKNDAAYMAHETRSTRSDLLEMGFDKKLVESLPIAGDDEQRKTRESTRFFDEDRAGDTGDSTDETQQDVVLIEEYVKTDIDDDGSTEVVQVFRVGGIILEWQEVDDHPFESFCPEMIPHKFFGQSLVDKTVENQRIKTVLTRQLLDGVYLANNPQREVPDDAVGDNTISDLLTYRVGGLVRTRRPNMLREIPITDRSTTALGAIQYFDQVREVDTGITRNSIGSPIDVDREQTRAEVEKVDRGESARKRLMARVAAETFVKRIYQKILALTIKYQDYERIVELRGKWVAVNPKYWDASMTATIQVGLGHAEREQRLNAAFAILQLQRDAIEQGFATKEHLWNTADIIVQSSGLQFTDMFFSDPTEVKDQPPQQDPEVLKVQQQGQLAQQKLQQDLQVNLARVQMEGKVKTLSAQQDAQIKDASKKRDDELDREKAQSDFAVDMQRIDSEFALGIRQLAVETELKQEEMRIETALAIQAAQVGAKSNGQLGGQEIRFGGKVG